MTTINASSMVPVSSLFPTVAAGNTASGTDTSAITLLEASAEDAASGAQYLDQMLLSDAPSTRNSGGSAGALFSILA